jgi:hypothetical protein
MEGLKHCIEGLKSRIEGSRKKTGRSAYATEI